MRSSNLIRRTFTTVLCWLCLHALSAPLGNARDRPWWIRAAVILYQSCGFCSVLTPRRSCVGFLSSTAPGLIPSAGGGCLCEYCVIGLAGWN